MHASVASWLWVIAESRQGAEAEELKYTVEKFFSKYSGNHGVCMALTRIVSLSNSKNSSTQQLAIKLLESNPNLQLAYMILASMVANNPGDSEVKSRAIKWLDANLAHTEAYQLLVPLIARSNGDEELIQRGLLYLKQPGTTHHQNIIGILLKAGKAESIYVEIALDFLNGQNPEKNKRFVYNNLVESLAYNPEHAFEYLYGVFPDSRKDIICKAISIGLK